LRKGDFVLIDLWAKKKKDHSVYADITWTGMLDGQVTAEVEKIFQVVKGGRDAALRFVQDAFAGGKEIQGWQVDEAARGYIQKAGFGEYFIHRTGHSIGEAIHGNGANMDNLETRDERKIIPRTSFSIEPGIYLPGKFGVRSEIDVYISPLKEVIVTGLPMQDRVKAILT
jgi:Xaa-Pro aminopeptidase